MKAFDEQIVSGSVLRSVWKLAWPVTLLNLVNGLHAFCDQILIGYYVPSETNAANAAVGAAWQVFLVIVVFISSLFHGMNVLVARYAGRQDRDNLSRVAYQAFLTAIIVLVCFMAPLGWFASPYLLSLIDVPEDVFGHALPYLRILFTCGAPLFLMFMIVGAFQASGDPKTPLVLGVLSTILNIVITAVLIAGLGPFPKMGTSGAALGTVLAPLASVMIALTLIMRKKMIIQPPQVFTLIPDLGVVRQIAKIGLPTGVQGVLLNVGGVALLRYFSVLEDDVAAAALAAYTLCYTRLFSLITWTSFGLRSACATVMGQNISAGQHARGKQAVLTAAALGGGWAVLIGLSFWFIPRPLLMMFNAGEGPVFEYGETLLRYLSVSGVMLAVTLAMTGGIQGAGETKIPMYIAFLTQIVVLLGLCGVFLAYGMLTPERIWLSILVSHTSRLVLTSLLFRTEGWTRTDVGIDDDPLPETESENVECDEPREQEA